MGIAEAIAALAKLLSQVLGWIQSAVKKTPTQIVQSDQQSIADEIKKTEETGRPQ